MNRLDPAALRHRLQEMGVWSKKSLGQHFLVDSTVLDVILRTAALQPHDIVVEIGPGPGVLTEKLLETAQQVIAFEFDPDMVRLLREDFPALNLHEGDALQEVPAVVNQLEEYKVVANIPYQITTPLMKLFLEGGVSNPPSSLTLLVQKEVGKRLAAGAGQSDRGYLSVLTQYYTNITFVTSVPATAFWPAPKVESAVIHLERRVSRPLPPEEERTFLKFVHTLFIQPRKQLKNVVAGIRGISAEQVLQLFKQLGFPENIRAQELTEEQWLTLFKSSL